MSRHKDSNIWYTDIQHFESTMQNDALTAKILVNLFQVSGAKQGKMISGGYENDARLDNLEDVAGEEDHKDGTGQTQSILNDLHS